MMRVFVAAVAVLGLLSWTLATAPDAQATPRQSLTSGAPCTTCHYNPDGGGIRSSIGHGNQLDNAAFSWEDLGLGFMDVDTNFLNDWLVVGFDARIQAARLGEPRAVPGPDGEGLETEMPDHRVFPMQFQPRVGVLPNDWLTILGTYAPGPDIGEGDLCSGVYPGQMCGELQVVAEPDPTLPAVRAGMFRPNIGVRHDDHTRLIDVDATRTRPEVIPPNWAEAGLESFYQPRYWFRADAGVYRSDQLSDALGDPEMVQAGDPAALGRVTFYPQFEAFDRSLFSWAGASTYASGHLRGEGNFLMNKAFFGIGLLDRGALILDVAHLDFRGEDRRRAVNASTSLEIEVLDWLIAEGRLEQAETRRAGVDEPIRRRSAVGGFRITPVPFVKFQPEYRLTSTDEWTMGHYALQVHLFC